MNSDDSQRQRSNAAEGMAAGHPSASTIDDTPVEEAEVREEFREFERLSLRIQRAMFWATFVVAITTSAYAVFSFLQWRALEDANRRTDNIIQLGISNLRFANKAAVDARKDTERALRASEGQATAMTNSIGPATTSAANAARDSVNAMVSNTRSDLRAWIVVDNWAVARPEVGKHFRIIVNLRNAGRTPAHNMTDWAQISPLPNGSKPNFASLPMPVSSMPGGSIAPNVFYHLTLQLKSPLTADDVNAITSGSVIIWVYGRSEYDDIFGRRHWMEFCASYNPSENATDICVEHNDVGDLPRTGKR